MLINNETLSIILENSFNPSWYVDITNNKVSFISKTPFKDLTGHTVDTFYKDPQFWFSLIHEEDRPLAESLYQQCLDSGMSEGQYRIIHADGTERWVRCRLKIVRGNSDQSIGMIGNTSDITQTILTAKVMKEQEMKLMTSARLASLGEMTASIAHEINTPLAIIVGSTSIMKKILVPGKENPALLKEQIEDISTTVQRIVKIIKGLQLLSRDSSNDSLEIESINKIISNTVAICQDKFKDKSIELEVDLDPAHEFLVKIRSIQISQVLLNLLRNSLDAISHEDEKWIRIHIEKDGQFIKVCVTDSGKGIRDDIYQKIMEPFFTTKRAGEGTGLGLSISHEIITKHNGVLYYDKDCSNTRFVIKLPLAV